MTSYCTLCYLSEVSRPLTLSATQERLPVRFSSSPPASSWPQTSRRAGDMFQSSFLDLPDTTDARNLVHDGQSRPATDNSCLPLAMAFSVPTASSRQLMLLPIQNLRQCSRNPHPSHFGGFHRIVLHFCQDIPGSWFRLVSGLTAPRYVHAPASGQARLEQVMNEAVARLAESSRPCLPTIKRRRVPRPCPQPADRNTAPAIAFRPIMI
ncbi:hypothetical protein CKAH01_10947 [Colletotrichum kahawae]|uniref:Uncharacterized protein n=1 Tax=Colletotrichum kahawae TaxID=34407 RepID=A0AAE0CWS6_COLKA|nr:hypothetical protein CKAH01_10947 [Colletotrichum kahawae]